MHKTTMALAAALFAAGCASDGDHSAETGRTAAAVEIDDVDATEEITEVEVVAEVPAEMDVTPAPAEVATRQFEMLKSLAGSWVGSGADDAMPDAAIEYQISSAGSAVVETIFPGQEHEMVSIYHMDNGKLVMTHYCAMGNQPFFTSVAGTEPGVIKFTCTGAGNTESHADAHMHEGVFTIGDGTLHTEWTMFKDLERGGTVVIDLVRGDM